MRRNDRAPAKGGWIQGGVGSLAGGVGLVSESLKARKEKKTTKKGGERNPDVPLVNDKEEAVPQQGEEHVGELPLTHASSTHSRVDREVHPSGKNNDKHVPETKGSNDQYQGNADAKEPEDSLENEWNLDDAQDEIAEQPEDNQNPQTSSEHEDAFLQHNKLPQGTKQTNNNSISLPVILPQRRPKDRSRGFIRAYAPVLENCNINQATWLDFLDTFQKSSAANPWIDAVNLAAFATMAIPHGFGSLVSLAIGTATSIAIEIQARGRTSSFLQKTNEEFFQPRGLYCLLMTWNPESVHRVEQANLTATIESRSNPQSGLKGSLSKYRSSDGKTYGDWEFPEIAPLVFPALDKLASQTSKDGEKEKSKLAKGMGFVTDYWDKRAAADYASKHPDSVLAKVPQQKFKSRYADPNHPAASGSVIAFLSGGNLIPGPNSTGLLTGAASVISQAVRGERQGAEWERYREKQRQEEEERRREQQNLYSRDYQGGYRNWEFGNSGIPIGPISTPIGVYKKILKKNVLYLMVVNMPSDEEMAAVKAAAHS